MRNLINLLESTHLEFIFEAPADDIISSLETTPFNDTIRHSGNTVYLLVPHAHRRDTIDQLVSILPAATYDPRMSGSSLGGITYLNGKIIIKPSGRQGAGSAGNVNELKLVSILDTMSQQYDKFTVEFRTADGKTFKVDDAIGVEHSGKKTKGRLKGDVQIVTTDKKHPISIKQVDAAMWESADSYYGATAAKIIDKLHAEGKIELTLIGKTDNKGVEYVKISPELVVEPTTEEVNDVIFGTDIKSLSGAVIIQTFADQHVTQIDDSITIECEAIIESESDIPDSHLMYWLIRNDSTRPNKHGYPGLRITAAVQTRAFGKYGNKNVVYVDSDGNELESPLAKVAKQQADQQASLEKQGAVDQKIQDIAQRTSTSDLRPQGAKDLRAKRGIAESIRREKRG